MEAAHEGVEKGKAVRSSARILGRRIIGVSEILVGTGGFVVGGVGNTVAGLTTGNLAQFGLGLFGMTAGGALVAQGWKELKTGNPYSYQLVTKE